MSTNQGKDVLSMFGLTQNQTLILFSIEKILVENDIAKSKGSKEAKELWLNEWAKATQVLLLNSHPKDRAHFLSKAEINKAVSQEHAHTQNNTWYYMIILEATLYRPYTPLGKDKKLEDAFKKLKYTNQSELLKNIVKDQKIMDIDFVDRYQHTYTKTLSRISGKKKDYMNKFLAVLAVTAIAAATAGLFAGPLAVALFGSQFVGLSGAALISASLAFAGGGAIAVGGLGIAGGTFAIVGGGALLGLVSGSAVIGGTALLVASVPDFALAQSAKLEVVLKEIIVNAQQDVKYAQAMLENYSAQIQNLNTHLSKMKLEQEQDKKAIANLKKSISYMERSYQDTLRFVSSYEIGANTKVS